jgi:hypothetical protein
MSVLLVPTQNKEPHQLVLVQLDGKILKMDLSIVLKNHTQKVSMN